MLGNLRKVTSGLAEIAVTCIKLVVEAFLESCRICFSGMLLWLVDKAKAAWPLRAATLKQQAMITRRSGKAASGKLVWNQHNFLITTVIYVKEYLSRLEMNQRIRFWY